MNRRPARAMQRDDDPAKMAAKLTASMARALLWLPEAPTLSRFAANDRSGDTPTANTLHALEQRGLARSVTLTGWWRVTDLGAKVRQHAAGAFQQDRVA